MNEQDHREIKTVKHDIKFFKKEIKQLEKENQRLKLTLEYKKANYKHINNELSKLKITNDKEQISNAEKKLNTLSQEISSITKSITETEKIISDFVEKISTITDKEENNENKTDDNKKSINKKSNKDSRKKRTTTPLANSEYIEKEPLPTEKSENSLQTKKQKEIPQNKKVGIAAKAKNFGKKAIRTTASAVGSAAVNTAKGAAKKVLSKFQPFSKSVNKNDVTDTGAESLRLATKTIKDGKSAINTAKNSIKTVDTTIKTTKRTIKTTQDVAKVSVKIVYKTAVVTVKAAKAFLVNAAAAVIVVVTNPLFYIIVAIFMIAFALIASIIILLGALSNNTGELNLFTGAYGLSDVPSEYAKGLEFYNTAVEKNKNDYYDIIDSMYYDDDDLSKSDLVYMEKTDTEGDVVIYERSFANTYQKNVIKGAWEMPIEAVDAIALAYVYMEKKLNDEKGTDFKIYEVTFSQEIFDEIISKCVLYSNTAYEEQACPDLVCTAIYTLNEEYDIAWEKRNKSVDAYNDWGEIVGYLETWYKIPDGSSQATYWNNNIGWRIDEWNDSYAELIESFAFIDNQGHDFLDELSEKYVFFNTKAEETPEYFIEEGCDYEHTLYAVGLAEYSKEDVMTYLGFDNGYITWYELTVMGFEANPDIYLPL